MLEQAVTSILVPIADKLGKMIRMLASDRDGDVILPRTPSSAPCAATGWTSTRSPKASRSRTAAAGES